ncbi:Cysteine proteinase inhibitor-like protein [Drosera capensis]
MARLGGITKKIGFENSLEIYSLAKFAVDRLTAKRMSSVFKFQLSFAYGHIFSVLNSLLEFKKVVNTKQQVVAGTMYYITLEATDGGKKKVYEAKVWVKPWMNFKEVQEFKYLGDAPAASSDS